MMHTIIAASDWWDIVGRTMLHYLWIGALVGGITFVVRRALARVTPHFRYVAALGFLAFLTVAPVGIAVYLTSQGDMNLGRWSIADPTSGSTSEGRRAPPLMPQAEFASKTQSANDVGGAALVVAESSPFVVRLEQAVDLVTRWLPWAWIVGTPLTLLFVASGLYGAERMKGGAVLVLEGPIARAYEQAAEVLRLSREVAIAVSDRIVTPLVVGIVRPMVLLPASAVSGWSPEQLEMILLHELAHVRRWDNLVNLLQRIIEAVLFYQPAVWVVSNWVRLEREHCCDAAVIGQGKEPQHYAETLASLAMPGISPQYAAAALASHQLVTRIRHILKVEERTMKISRKTLITLVGSIVLSMSLVAVYAQQQSSEAPKASDAQAKKQQSESGHPAADFAKKEELFRHAEQRLVKASKQAEAIREAYRQGTVTLDLYVDALLREADSIREFAMATDEIEGAMRRSTDTKRESADWGFPMAAVALSEPPSRASDSAGNPQARTEHQLVQKAYEDTYTAQINAAQALAETEKLAGSADAGTYIKQVDGLLISGLIGMNAAAKRDWSADQLTGQPDATAGADDRKAWASATADSQGEWIELSYEKPVEAVAVVIFETHNPGAIGSVKAFATEDRWIWILDQRSARPSERRSQATTLPIQWGEPVNRIRITLESVSVPGWNEIDAVGLLDNRGQVHWATSAKASSEWGQESAGSEEYQKAVKFGLNWIKEHQQGCTRAPRQTNCATCHDSAAHSKLDMKDWRSYTHDGAKRAVLEDWIGATAARGAAGEPESAERQRRLEQLRAEIAETDRQLATIQEEVELERARVDKRQQLDNLRIALDQMRVPEKPAAVSGPLPMSLPMAPAEMSELQNLRFELDRERSAIAECDEIEKLKQELKALRSQRQYGEDYLPAAATPETPKLSPKEVPAER